MRAVPDPPTTPIPGLMRLASQLAGPADADDLVQATHVRALEHGNARASWLRTVMRNEQWMAVRARKRRDAREREVEAAPAIDVEHVVHCLQVARLVQALLDALDDELALVVRERYFEDRSAAEIAARHGIPAGTVRWRLKTALDRLRAELDAHHGGERMLWAGAFAPTVAMPAASLPSTAGDATAAVKGSSIMSITGIKILLAATSVAATGATATYIARPATTPTETTSVVAHEVVATRTPARDEARAVKREADKARWSDRLTQIHAAHRERAPASPPPSATWTSAKGLPTPQEHMGECVAPTCSERLTSEVLAMVDGCDELLGDAMHDATVEAKVVGAPEIGTVIESVELQGGADMSPELRECLTESMYALDLGAADRSFAQTVTLVMGGVSVTVDALEHEDLDPASRAELEAVFAENADDPRPVQMILVSEPEAPQ
ncbi:MAG TPA: sigma-70 family RNA polymerase sigma factor [Nannocystaceae bacterium]|nr:sigma-70 family RNA polymerase sigma factor [Nannocystaceae bacterium]